MPVSDYMPSSQSVLMGITAVAVLASGMIYYRYGPSSATTIISTLPNEPPPKPT